MQFKFFLFLLFPIISTAQISYEWAFALGGQYSDVINDVVVDSNGNIYVVGSYASSFDFDPNEGIFELQNPVMSNIFFAKFNNEGNFVFVKSIGVENLAEYGYNISVDHDNNIYISGEIGNNADMDTGDGVVQIQTNGSLDPFVAKYDSLGNYIFSWTINATSAYASTEVSKNGDILVYGIFSNLNDFELGTGEYIIDGGDNRPYLAKYSNNYDLIFVLPFDTVPYNNEFINIQLTDIYTDNQNNTLITGHFKGGIDFDTGSGEFSLYSETQTIFIAKYNSIGNLIFAKKLEPIPGASFNQPKISLDNLNNIFIADGFTGTVDFDPGTDNSSLTSINTNDIFFAKYDSLGNFIFVKGIQGDGQWDFVSNLQIDNKNNIYINGLISGTIDLDPGWEEMIYQVSGEFADIFIAKFDNEGNYITSVSMGGTNIEIPYGMALDQEGNVYLAGEFYEEINPFPGGEDFYYSNGYQDIFVAKYAQNLLPATIPTAGSRNVGVSPNPSTGLYRITLNDVVANDYISITDITGKPVKDTISTFGNEIQIDIGDAPAGIYFVQLGSGLSTHTLKLIKL